MLNGNITKLINQTYTCVCLYISITYMYLYTHKTCLYTHFICNYILYKYVIYI